MEERVTTSDFARKGWKGKVKDYFQLIKFTLSFMVVFSTVVSFLIAMNGLEANTFTSSKLNLVLLLFVAGMLVTGAANSINQILEKDSDALMKRTLARPVASGRMSKQEATVFALVAGIAGVGMMWYFFNFQSAMLSLGSLFLYGFIYTPLKTVNSIAVLVGAIPGALPCLIGWVAATDSFSAGGWILFSIQLIWQFPHFWAIAWLAHEDYTKAGFRLLPGDKGPTKFTALQTVIYSVLMIPVGMLPYLYNISGVASFWILLGCNLWMVYVSWMLYMKMDKASARKVMFSSYIYLMIVLLSLFVSRPHV
jgi:protoheme IX farnesyltransferase